MALRIDSAKVKAARNDAGFLVGEAFVTRTGVFTYRLADGWTRRELRRADEVFASASLKSLENKAVTRGHPHEPVTSKNASKYQVGVVGGGVRADGRFVRAPFTVTNEDAITAIESGQQRELSCGYNCDLDETPGVFEGERYDAVQRNIRYDHLATVTAGRAGPEVSIRLDAADAVCIDSFRADSADHQPQQESKMKIRIDGVEYEVTEQLAQAFAAHTQKRDGETAALKADLEKAKGRADALEEEAKRLRADSADDKVAARVAARVKLEGQAGKVLGADFKADGKSDDDLRRAVIAKVTPTANLDGKSADYVSARFDTAIEIFDAGAKKGDETAASNAAARATITNADGAQKDEMAEARKKMVEAQRNRGLQKITAA